MQKGKDKSYFLLLGVIFLPPTTCSKSGTVIHLGIPRYIAENQGVIQPIILKTREDKKNHYHLQFSNSNNINILPK